MAEVLLDALFIELSETKLRRLLKAELGDPLLLNGFRYDPVTRARRRALGPPLAAHIFSGNVPNPAIISFILGMLLKSANIGKVSSKNEGFLDVFLESLRSHDAKLASTNLLLDPEDRQSTRQCLERSDLVVAYGTDETIRQIREMVPRQTPFFGYGYRISFSLVTAGALRPAAVRDLARKTSLDARITDQGGCLSPLWVFAGTTDAFLLTQFAKDLKHELDRDGKGRWLVICDEGLSGLSLPKSGRVIRIKPFKKIKDVFEAIQPFKKWLQCVSLEALKAEREKIADGLSANGVNRICRAGRMQFPPLTWHHDGRPNFSDWVKWVDWEE